MVPIAQPKYRPLRRIALASIVLMGLTVVAAVIQAVVMWTSYDEVKRFIYGLLSEEELDRGVQSIAGTGPLLDLSGYLFLATGIAFLIWLWQARENTEVLKSAFAYQGGFSSGPSAHRHEKGWAIGGWFCPIVQFWYPLQVVEDVVTASEPAHQPGAARSGRIRTLLYGWWGTWTGFWVILVGGGAVAMISFISWIVRLVSAADAADAAGDYVDIYDLQDFMVRVALAVNIGFTVATILLIVAGITVSLLMHRVTSWQDGRVPVGGPPLGPALPDHSPSHLPPVRPQDGPPPGGPPQYAPRPSFPTYATNPSGPNARPQTYGPEQYGGTTAHPTYGPGTYRGTTGHLAPNTTSSVAQAATAPGPHGPGGYGGTLGTSPTTIPTARPGPGQSGPGQSGPNHPGPNGSGSSLVGPPTTHQPPRADHPTDPIPTTGPDQDPPPGGATPWQPPH
ncbi:DUF4328 domain-containing protein [Kribbella caucasensis]|nr:DUF4328 domain-containing protein [Kribbella sp. VKM Ac-2527]